MLGGYVGDRLLGKKHGILLGIICYLCGTTLAAISLHTFYWSLSFIALGAGLCESNILSFIGALYKEQPHKRQHGFKISYMLLNTTFIGVYLLGLYYTDSNLRTIFFIYSIFLVIALYIFITQCLCQKNVRSSASRRLSFFNLIATLLLLTVAIYGSHYILLHNHLLWSALTVLLILVSLYITRIAHKYNHSIKKRIYFCLCIALINVLFSSLYSVLADTTMLYSLRAIKLSLGTIIFTANTISSFNGLFIILLIPALIYLSYKNKLTHILNNSMISITTSFYILGIAFAVLILSTSYFKTLHQLSISWAIIAYFFLSLAEILINPVAYATISENAPEQLQSTLQATYALMGGGAGFFGAQLATLASIPKQLTHPYAMDHIYHFAFSTYFAITVTIATILVLVYRPIQKLIAQ